jgi:hypothetical protein
VFEDGHGLMESLQTHVAIPNGQYVMEGELFVSHRGLNLLDLLMETFDGVIIELFQGQGVDGEKAVGDVLGDRSDALSS